MFQTKSALLASSTVLLITTGALSVPSKAIADDSSIPPPQNLQVTAVYSDAVYLAWTPGSDDPALSYRVHNLTLGWTQDTEATSMRWGIGLRSGRTYSFAVTHVNSDNDESAQSNQVTATPTVTPPTNVGATLDSDTVTITWGRPSSIDPSRPGSAFYYIYLDGVPETHAFVSRSADPITVSIPRVQPGTTHNYTVSYGRLVSEPALLPIPASEDTTPPTTPSWKVTCTADGHGWMITNESTDDTTPQSHMRYEFLEYISTFGLSVINYNLPRAGDHLEDFSTGNARIRAVDEAGNRSGLASAVWDC